MSKTIRLGTRLRYPITIVKLLKSPGETVKKQERLLQYSFKWTKEVGDTIRGETWEEEQTTIADWDSPADGELRQWNIKEGELIEQDQACLVIKEACSHEIQFQGLCAICGKDMTEVNWATDSRDTERAPISMVHDQTNLTVSQVHAQRTEHELQRRLLLQRKLSLVVDLDQTIIHACIDPTVGEWQRDPSNPNHESVKDVKSFQLEDGPRGVARGCWYYIKMRPGLEGFLKRISTMYELHVYTMGTRAYAREVARVVDPNQRLFGNRVISRDENGNMYAKSLQRLFPVNTNMVLIIDDRADVWPRNRHNLIKVSPYDFFKGIGDINSSFLPPRTDTLPSETAVATTNGLSTAITPTIPTAAASAAAVGEPASALDDLVSMSGGEDATITQLQIEEQARTLERQINERPLQALQEKLDKEDEEAEKSTTPSEDGEETPSSPSPHPRHQVLLDDDHELSYLEQHLTELHRIYYEEYDRKRALHRSSTSVDLAAVPDVGQCLELLKSRALRGVKVVLSGLIPIGVDLQRSEIGQQVISFGAELRNNITKDVTHLVVSALRPRTKKVRQAARIPSIKIVNKDWLEECFSQWAIADEEPYLFEVHPDDRPGGRTALAEGERERLSDADEDEGPPRLRLVSASGDTRELDEDEDEGDESESEDDLIPDFEDGETSPIDGLKSFNWNSADEELNEFLAGDSDDSDDVMDSEDGDEELTAGTGTSSGGSRKRKLGDDDDDEEEEEDAETEEDGVLDEPSSRPEQENGSAKRLKRTTSRGKSSLRNQFILPTPLGTGDEEEDAAASKALEGGLHPPPPAASQTSSVGGDSAFDDIDEAELEADFMAEFAAADAPAPAPVPATSVGKEVGGESREKG
ncbi:hypothetical protein B0T19DRAFT_493041 [Cercophora scortea]|uniref:RNA polymerase II subunit A C-terminal domain phosphatase n=1 Tax=Cercophora scortea TaxID=314031 RepID=A0AAE0I7H2_9PEZI|nr:hypothetical protein B0T19DRAFT_493041 [Cercophora scortea]